MDAMPVLRQRRSFSSLFLCILLLSCCFWNPACSTLEQGDALQEVKNAGWISVALPSWMPGTDPCVSNWVGIDCDTTGNIITLNLTHVGLKGPVPKAVGRLTTLLHLDVGNNKVCEICGPWNHVTGDLAPLATLVNLQTLILTSNELSLPSFPKAVFQLTKLSELRFDNTLIKGELPLELSTLSDLQYLYLGNNSFTGIIPGAVLGSLTKLKELTIWGNALTGVMPAELGNLANLTYLNLNKNNLYGGLTPELGRLTKLRKLLLYKNKFTGPVPEEWRGMISIQDLEVNANALFGTLPPWLLQIPTLSILQLSNNQLQGSTLPVLNASITPGLKFLYVECNYLNGSRPLLQNVTALLDYNCWENESSMDSACVRALNCLNFQLSVNNGNSCPACPTGQHMVNSTTCICFGDLGGSSKKFRFTVVVAVVAVVAFLLLLLSYILWRARHKSKNRAIISHPDYFQTEKEGSQMLSWEVPRGVHHFTMEELMKATNGFDQANEIGEGGFGKVFVGKFPDGRTLAIKRAGPANYASASGRSQFRNEVSLLSRLHHKNLVRLEGFCEDGNQQILVYEYMKLGNLHSHLHGRSKGQNMTLDWYKRLEIAVNVAQGLDYLHSFADPPVIHRDVKPSNILLDDNLVAKVADFGISKESPELDTHVSTRPAGTAGYFDPQYFLLRQLTTASDVYSFGVVLLELITGRKAIEFHCPEEESNLIEWQIPGSNSRFKQHWDSVATKQETKAQMKAGQSGVERVVDPELGSNYPRDLFVSLVDLGLRCADFKRNTRPTMKFVVSVLEPLLHESDRPTSENNLLTCSSSTTSICSPAGSHNRAGSSSGPSGFNERAARPKLHSFTRIDMDTVLFPR